jgi:hypothetical protein
MPLGNFTLATPLALLLPLAVAFELMIEKGIPTEAN